MLEWHSRNFIKRQKKRKDSVEDSSKQSKFIVKDGGFSLVNKDGKSKTLSTEDMTTKAEICRCLDIIDSHCSFRTADADNEKYRKMFPDLVIANSYKQKSDNVKYMLQFGVAPFMRSATLNFLFTLMRQQHLKSRSNMIHMLHTTLSILVTLLQCI